MFNVKVTVQPAAHFEALSSINRQWGLGNELWQDLMVVHMGGLGGTVMLESVDGKGIHTNALQATQWCSVTDDGLEKRKLKAFLLRAALFITVNVLFFSLRYEC